MKLSWRRLQAQRQPPPPGWGRGPGGAIPETPRQARKPRLGTDAWGINRRSEKMHRLIRSAFVAVIELMAVVFACSLIGRAIAWLYEGASTGRAIIQTATATLGAAVWLLFTRERYKAETRSAIAHARNQDLTREARTTELPRVGADQAQRQGREPGLGRQDLPRPKDPRSNFERDFDQHKGISGPD